ncbi:hypothetical protein EV385_2494 [Krasilnikovia cinnamomea]|uniref:Uncharacterized protein n=1 Tax=Krasilnikovia cinnamomea TaxID=349313 RepID=A0A4Q7ZJN3_9ACTN|nr:hypothetical protein [Krasilnikovia cinnamomea]RZU50714.1 hypothetical protein EV385_2494 [Krasilnikovia cinnamomea]
MWLDRISTDPDGMELKPLRLNFAQVCLWCGRRWCGAPECVAAHAASTWVVCPACDGFEMIDCLCNGGLVEAGPGLVAAQRGRVLPVTAAPAEVATVSGPGPETA